MNGCVCVCTQRTRTSPGSSGTSVSAVFCLPTSVPVCPPLCSPPVLLWTFGRFYSRTDRTAELSASGSAFRSVESFCDRRLTEPDCRFLPTDKKCASLYRFCFPNRFGFRQRTVRNELTKLPSLSHSLSFFLSFSLSLSLSLAFIHIYIYTHTHIQRVDYAVHIVLHSTLSVQVADETDEGGWPSAPALAPEIGGRRRFRFRVQS